MRAARLFGAAALLSIAAAACTPPAREPALPEAPARWVTDRVGFVSDATRAELDARLERYQAATGHQVLVWIGPTSAPWGRELFAVRAFEKWRVGRARIDDGLVLFVFASDREAWIEVGYGVEDRVTDADASRIIAEQLVPRFRANDRDGGVRATVDALLRELGGEPGTTTVARGGAEQQPPPSAQAPGPPAQAQRPPSRAPPGVDLGRMIVFGIIGLVFLILFLTNPRLALLLLWTMGRGGGGWGGGGFGGGGGGGFSGGGGRSGGGGAGGSW